MTDKIRLNLGSCDLYKKGWINIDNSTSSHIKADLVADVLDLSAHFDPESVDEIYCGHLIEHLTEEEGAAAMDHWRSLLTPGGVLTVVTPDFKVLVEHYLAGDIDLRRLHNEFTYSYYQESHHKWLYDQESLFELFSNHGFTDLQVVDRFADPELHYHDSLQCGVRGKRAN